MSTIKIKDLVEKRDNLQDEDLFVIEDSEDTKKITLLKLRSAFSMDSILISMKDMLLNKINTFMESHNSRYTALEERNKQLEVTCNNLENDHIHDANRIFELEDKLIKQSNLIKTLQIEKNNLNTILVVLQSENSSLFEQISQLNNILNEKEVTIDSLNSDYEHLQGKYNELNIENTNLKNTVESLETEYNNKVDEFINNTNSNVSSKIEELMTYIRYYHPDVDSLEV